MFGNGALFAASTTSSSSDNAVFAS